MILSPKKAMILAAGKGTRLRPLTESVPKALVPILSKPALEYHVRRLAGAGFSQQIINSHYLGEQVEAFINDWKSPDATLTPSVEATLLGTGGGIKQTAWFWKESPLLVHNVDVFHTVDLETVFKHHQQNFALATLLTQTRQTQTRLLIDQDKTICGIHYEKKGDYRVLRQPVGELREQGFCGIHVLSSRLGEMLSETGEFSIIDSYLRLIQSGEVLKAFDIGSSYWIDIGTPEKLKKLEADLRSDKALRQAYLTTLRHGSS